MIRRQFLKTGAAGAAGVTLEADPDCGLGMMFPPANYRAQVKSYRPLPARG